MNTSAFYDKLFFVSKVILTTEQKIPAVLIIVLPYKSVLTFESVDDILKCDHSNESY